MAESGWSDEIPLKLGPCSNGEYVPLAMAPLAREAGRRTMADADAIANRLHMSRRRFLASLSGSALALTNLAACSREQRAAERRPEPAGTYTLPTSSTTEPEAAAEVLAGPDPIIDVQTHLLDLDLTTPTPNRFFGSGFPQAQCGLDDPRDCFSIETFLDEVFIRSDTNAIVLSALPAYGEANPLTLESMELTRRMVLEMCGDPRVYVQGQGAPMVGDPDGALAAMDAVSTEHDLVAWKVYTHSPDGWFLDDHDASRPPVGTDFIRRAVDGGVPIIAVHKGLSGGAATASPVDIGPAALRHRDAAFLVYHSGYEVGVPEGPFDAAAPNQGVDRLVLSLTNAGVEPGQNVYAELGSTWRNVMADPDQAAHLLGKLLLAVGEDRVLWGTDSIWYGSPQDQIEAFRAFEISEASQEQFGYPALTTEIKAKILGGNAARLHNIDAATIPCPFTREQLREAREEMAAPHLTYGPLEADEIALHLAAHGSL